MTDLLQLGTALLLGLVHSIDVDHAVAVSTLVSGRPALPVAVAYGVRWGLGHSVAVLAAGIVVLGFGVRIDPRFDRWAEILVGVMLIGLGLLSLRTLGNLHLHGPPSHGDHAHLHSHRPAVGHEHPHQRQPDPRHHPRRPLVVGLFHGLAGSSGALAIVPMTMISDWWVGVAYLVVFCVGVTGGMVLFALGLAEAIRRATTRSLVWGRRIGRGIALVSVVVGGWWVVR
jgi:ABC-type nickel/cobalt efflux system permease component RcnA